MSDDPAARHFRPASAPGLAGINADLMAGLTVALVAVPQCIGFAAIAGLPASSGIYTALAMGILSAALSGVPKLVIGPAITASTMLLAVLSTAGAGDTEARIQLAGFIALLVGAMTVLGALLNVGKAARFVSRSVIVGLMAGSGLLTISSQLAPALGMPSSSEPVLIGILWSTLQRATQLNLPALAMAAGTLALLLLGRRVGPRFPAAFAALLLSGVAAWLLEQGGQAGALAQLPTIGPIEWEMPRLRLAWHGLFDSDVVVGAAAICAVGIIQNLAIGRALTLRQDHAFNPGRELWTLGLANAAAGLVRGFPGSASFARSALNDLAGARTRLAALAAALATGVIAWLGAPAARYVTMPAIAGLLVATALTMVEWRELAVLLRDRHDRPVLATTLIGVLFLPIHWAILIGLAMSIAILLRRVSRLYLFEMVAGEDAPFREREIDDRTGSSAITMLQVEGPLFFAHADLLYSKLRTVFARRPRVTILRMRRTQQIDFSVMAALDRVMGEYLDIGGHVVICGLAPEMRAALLASPLGKTIGEDFLLETTREVFGSAHLAIGLAEAIVDVEPQPDRPRFRRHGATLDVA